MRNVIVWDGITILLFVVRCAVAFAVSITLLWFVWSSFGVSLLSMLGCAIVGLAVFLILGKSMRRA